MWNNTIQRVILSGLMLLKQRNGLLNNRICLVHHLEILAHIPKVSCHKRFELKAQLRQTFLPFCLIFGLNLVLFGRLSNVVKQRLWHFIACKEGDKVGILLLQCLAMCIHIFQIGIDDVAPSSQLSVERRIKCGVKRHEIVGHNAATAIDKALFSQRFIL